MAITIDEMLELLSFAGTELVNGNSNHGPMASEALFAMGRDDAVQPWVEGYRDRLTTRVAPSLAIPRDEWREYLGSRERLGDWIQLFENELSEAAWQDVVRLWVPRLAPAVMAVATHGLIRTAHAARSLSSGEPLFGGNAAAEGGAGAGTGLLHPAGGTVGVLCGAYAQGCVGAGGAAARPGV